MVTHRQEHTGEAGLDRIQNNVRDLVAYVRAVASVVGNRAYAALAVDTTIGVAAYAELVSTTITTTRASSFLDITFSASGVKTVGIGTPGFRIVVDGVVAKGLKTVAAGATYSFNVAMTVRVPVAPRTHTVKVDWATDTNGLQIKALTVAEEHASLLVQESAV